MVFVLFVIHKSTFYENDGVDEIEKLKVFRIFSTKM